jgi:hypothetical protein
LEGGFLKEGNDCIVSCCRPIGGFIVVSLFVFVPDFFSFAAPLLLFNVKMRTFFYSIGRRTAQNVVKGGRTSTTTGTTYLPRTSFQTSTPRKSLSTTTSSNRTLQHLSSLSGYFHTTLTTTTSTITIQSPRALTVGENLECTSCGDLDDDGT